MTRAALPHLTNRGGHVLMISSLAGSNPAAGMAAYGASKAALDYFAHCLMLEVRAAEREGHDDRARLGGHQLLRPRAARLDLLDARPPRTSRRRCVDLLRMRDGAHSSRVEMRPARPQKR